MPEVSIVLPIIDRLETFVSAIPLALEQSLGDLELLIAMSGATGEVREAARNWGNRDQRIRLIDTAPSPRGRTGIARHLAIETARSDKILILQDDDDWAPDHAEYMSGLLDLGPVVSNPVRAVTLSHREMAWHPALHLMRNRESARDSRRKNWYEAHYGFRRSFYRQLGIRWDQYGGTDVGLSGHFSNRVMDTAIDVDWISGTKTTSWSFNSPLRQNPGAPASIADRVAERDNWRGKRMSGLLGRPLWTEHFFLQFEQAQQDGMSFDTFIGELGLYETGLEKGSPEDRELRALHRGLSGGPLSDETLVMLLPDLLETGQNMFMPQDRADTLLYRSNPVLDGVWLARAAARRETGIRRATCLAYAALCAVRKGLIQAADELWNNAMAADARITGIARPVPCLIARAKNDATHLDALLAPYRGAGELPGLLNHFQKSAGVSKSMMSRYFSSFTRNLSGSSR